MVEGTNLKPNQIASLIKTLKIDYKLEKEANAALGNKALVDALVKKIDTDRIFKGSGPMAANFKELRRLLKMSIGER